MAHAKYAKDWKGIYFFKKRRCDLSDRGVRFWMAHAKYTKDWKEFFLKKTWRP